MNNPEDGGRQSEGPVIAIYRHPHRPGCLEFTGIR